jgi:N-acetyl-alpha-D-muramate 1-phosphate uridylyltransferase
MRALIFAAGRGERMQPLTLATPKPLLVAGGKPLIVWHLEALARIGIIDIVINTAHLAAQFPQLLGDGSRYGLRIAYSYEGEAPLETGGGMRRALPLLGAGPFIAVNGDIWCDYDFARLPREPAGDAHLVLVDNPPQHARGDFTLDARGFVGDGESGRLTFAGIGVYRPAIIAGETRETFKLAPFLYAAARERRVTGEHHRGAWTDVGTPERLAALDAVLSRESVNGRE